MAALQLRLVVGEGADVKGEMISDADEDPFSIRLEHITDHDHAARAIGT